MLDLLSLSNGSGYPPVICEFKYGEMNTPEKCPVFVAIIRNVGVS